MSKGIQIKTVLKHLEQIAPPVYQEGYDNAGLIVGDPKAEVTGVLICLDSTEAVIEEAISLGCNLIIAHHPIVFKGLKRFTGRNYVERTVISAIKNDIAIYAAHTNLDNVYHQGVNAKIAEMLGLQNTRVLSPKAALKKLVAYVAPEQVDTLRKQLLELGAGQVMGTTFSFSTLGVATTAENSAASIKLEVTFPIAATGAIKGHLKSQGIAFEVLAVEIKHPGIGSGMIGELAKPQKELAFLKKVKSTMKAGCVKHTQLLNKEVKKVAVCGGAGGFLLSSAISAGADVFITADYKYHEFFDADGRIVIADIGHYESEQYTIELLQGIVSEKFSTFAAYCTKVNTNPVQYL